MATIKFPSDCPQIVRKFVSMPAIDLDEFFVGEMSIDELKYAHDFLMKHFEKKSNTKRRIINKELDRRNLGDSYDLIVNKTQFYHKFTKDWEEVRALFGKGCVSNG